MPYIKIDRDVELFYTEQGTGTPVIFLHGVWMSSRFFKKQLPYFSKHYQTFLLDFRGHGQSSMTTSGHTIAQYAKDLYTFIEKKQLKEVVLVGWSMGAFVVWEYLKQFGEENIKGTVIVDEMASDFKWPDFPLGAFDMATLIHFMRGIQTDREALLRGFLPLMFKREVDEADLTWMLKETMAMPENIASAILFDQSVVDYRNDFQDFQSKTLLCFGREEKLIPVAAGEQIRDALANVELEIFNESCHCPFLEEPALFNTKLDTFIRSL
ncbi:alpha/beta hydrolase [Ectobacillus sp. JY-23]|uniref:alpha/beta fold hydrolase n=1 Tax=Ectobacillus sp. JY-23 TaxID=2933872 RepID=UPI001FF11EA1|nr:alpha/beta hydrolase [Ectobacillus sp. JY-23]UOY92970.1 alpha/beta hydrolase [Ectobacillus sp. JY-23]